MSNTGLILIGAGGHARSCIDVIEAHGEYKIAGLVGMECELDTKKLGYRVIATDDELPALIQKHQLALIATGQVETPRLRIDLYGLASKVGFILPSIVSPYARASSHASLGAGCILMHGALVNAGAKVGVNCILNSCSIIEHDVVVGNHCHISTGAIVNGGANVGDGSFIGSGSTVREGVSIGRGCVIGMGVTVRQDIPDGARYLGRSFL